MHSDFKALFTDMISGTMPDEIIAQHLQDIESRGVSEVELFLGAQTLREKMDAVHAPKGAMDIVGTGGDGLSTYNISTACAFVVAGAGVPVAKHGNRAVSSKSGASDVLRTLGVKLDISKAQAEHCLEQAGLTFLFAPNHHKAMANVTKARAMLSTRTIFNCLGPLSNPANVEYILVGVYSNTLRKSYAKALLSLGAQRALIVHGGDGMDEITTTTSTLVSEIKNGDVTEYEITPEQYGLARTNLKDLEGGDAAYNATALLGLLAGEQSAYMDIVMLNSGAALYAADKASTIAQGIQLARASISTGKAKHALGSLIKSSNG